MHSGDPLQRVLFVDLSKQAHHVEHRPDLFEARLGGAGAAIALLEETDSGGTDPYAPGRPIVLAVGPLTGLFPLASKTVAMFPSPLTGNLGESHAGGRSAVALRMAGFGAVVITGRADRPVTLAVHGDDVAFRDASSLWGMGSQFTAGRILREREGVAGQRSILRIGRAGENRVPMACVTTETYRHFGRLGLGAMFGAKHLKAVVISGRRRLPAGDARTYRAVYDRIFKSATASTLMKKYHDLGTAQNIAPLNALGGLPSKNLQAGRLDGAEGISGEHLAEHYLGRRLACAHCPVGCIHIAALREPYENVPYFYKTSMISYDYELLYALGSMLGITDAADVLRLIDAAEKTGLDVMSAGVALAWATEAQEKGLITEEETGNLSLRFGDAGPYRLALAAMAEGETDFYRALGRGVAHAATLFGGEDFACHFGGNEMPGYHTGPASVLGHFIGARHSHLDNGGYGVDQKNLTEPIPEPDACALSLIDEERWRQVLSSLVVCFFARKVYPAEIVALALACAGFQTDEASLARLGREVHAAKYRYKFRHGFRLDAGAIPQRALDTPAPAGNPGRPWFERALRAAREEIDGAIAEIAQ